MTAFHLYAAGTRSAATLIESAPDYATALSRWIVSQGTDKPAWAIVPANAAAFPGLDSIAPGYDLGSHGRGVYVERCGDGVTTRGFRSLADQAARVADWLGSQVVGEATRVALATYRRAVAVPGTEPGTPAAYVAAKAIMGAASAHCAASRTKCPVDLIPALVGLEGKRVEVIDSYGDRRRFVVGKSSGWLPIHLEISSSRSIGGSAVSGFPFRSIREVR